MKIRIIRSKFIDALKTVQNIVASKGALQILQNVMMETGDGQISLTTTDLDVSVRATAQCEVEAAGATTLPVKLLFNTVTKLAEGPVEIDVDNEERARITAGSATFKIAGLPVSDFPALPADSEAFAYVLPQMTLREMLRKTAYATSQDETRKTLKGVLMSFKDGKLTMVATDGRRLALVEHEVEFPADAEREAILPTKLVAELMRSLTNDGDVRITIEKSQVAFSFGTVRIYSKLLDEVYPNYRQVIPQQCVEHVVVDRQLLLSALERANVMMSEDSSSTKLVFDSNELTVLSIAADKGEARDQVPIKYEGPRIEISFNPSFVMDPLKAIDDDEVTIEMNNGNSPAIIKCSVPFLYVMMPLRIN